MSQIILTWVSWSGKTTLMNELTFNWCSKPIQFTTRKPRSDKELDDYVFLNKKDFAKKLLNWDFVEYVWYNNNHYAITKHFDKTKSNVFIVDPVWRAQLIKHFKLNNIKYTAFFLEIPIDEARRRLEDRGEIISSIEKRLEDFKYFSPSGDGDKILDWRLPIKSNVEKVLKYVH